MSFVKNVRAELGFVPMDTHGRLERTWRMESVKSDKGPTAETGSGLVVNDPGPSNGGL